MPDLQVESQDIDDYLCSTEIVDYDNHIIEEATEQLTEDLRDEVSKARAIYEFVRDQILHSFDINATSVTLSASEVLENGHGICFAKSHLLAAMMRSAGIPAGFCYQLVKSNGPVDKLSIHALNAIYLESQHKWIRLDARGNNEEMVALFSTTVETLVHTIRPDQGEKDGFVIFTEPPKKIIRALKQVDSLNTLTNLLPASII